MGANAQIAVPAFTSGQVLTAAQQTQINTGIPVFATTVTRDAAFGGSGEKVLAQGQYAYIEATSSLQVYSGSAWVSASSAGLTLLTSETSVSAVSAITVDSIFTSTYTNYLIMLNALASGADTLNLKFRAAGVTTSTGYGTQRLDVDGTSVSAVRTSAQTSGNIGALRTATRNSIPLYVFAPQIAQWTTASVSFLDTVSSTAFYKSDYSSVQATTTQFDGFTIFCTTATLTGTYSIYGFNK